MCEIKEFIVNKKRYQIIALLGKGKGGYSYLAKDEEGQEVVLKKIHHEPCDYYSFGNKIEAEKKDYNILLRSGIAIPKLIYIDEKQEIIIKEYIKGKTIKKLLEDKQDIAKYIPYAKKIEKRLIALDINIDYYPSNFIFSNGELIYIDYETNVYDKKWDFINWGLPIWKGKE